MVWKILVALLALIGLAWLIYYFLEKEGKVS